MRDFVAIRDFVWVHIENQEKLATLVHFVWARKKKTPSAPLSV